MDLLRCAMLPAAARAGEIDTLLFGSLDAGAPTYVTTGVKIGVPALDRGGAVALASLGGGWRDERGSAGARRRYSAAFTLVAGYQWVFDWGVVAAFAGPEITREMLVGSRGPALLPVRYGLRLHDEIWARPTEATLLQMTVIAGSARDSLWARAAWGYRLWGAYLGPELSLYTDATGYRKWNFGVHATDFAVGRSNVRVSAGVQTETGRRTTGPYVALAVWSPW